MISLHAHPHSAPTPRSRSSTHSTPLLVPLCCVSLLVSRSAYYEDTYSFNMYSGTKNYLGHSKLNEYQLFVYSDVHPGYGSPVCFQSESDGDYDEPWNHNKCILLSTFDPLYYSYCDIRHPERFPPHANNTFYTPTGRVNMTCGSQHLTLEEWQAQTGQEKGSTNAVTPNVSTVIEWGKQVLYLRNGYHVEGELSW